MLMRAFAARAAALANRAKSVTLPIVMIVCALGLAANFALQSMMNDAGERARNTELASGAPRALSDVNAARAAISDYEHQPNSEKSGKAQLYVQILLSRLDSLGAGVHRELLDDSPRARKYRALAAARAEHADEEFNAETPDLRVIDADLDAVAEDLEIFAAEALTYGSSKAAGYSARASALAVGQLIATLAMLAAITVGLILAVRQNRRLAQANAVALSVAGRFERLAKCDPLTDLANRGAGHELAAALFARARAKGARVGAMSIDVDRFKQINDTLGHRAGDALLKKIASCLAEIAAKDEDAFAARLGGDEFWICRVLPPSPDSGCADEMESFGREAVNTLSGERLLDKHRVSVAISVGVACGDPQLIDHEELLAHADMALRNAKERGRARVSMYQSGMAETRRRRLELENALQGAQARGEFTVFYQPVIASRTGEPDGVEALLRWTHPKFGPVSPAEFIPIAEDTGAIAAIGEWVLRRACADIAPLKGLRVAVNVSAMQLMRANLSEQVRDALADSGLDPHRLELEITETALVRDEDRARVFIAEMSERGVEVALDDFGVGYSSLSYLRRFAFARLKMDRSFVNDLDDPVSHALARAILDIAAALHLRVTAEGVETASQAMTLTAEGCENLQGFLFARPMPLDALRDWLAADRQDVAAA